jgi:hypothetical protein
MKSLILSTGLVTLGSAYVPVKKMDMNRNGFDNFGGWLECQACYTGVGLANDWLQDEKSIAPVVA